MFKIVVAIPCLNEEATVFEVVAAFRRAIPEAEVVVFDNGSTDGTAVRARLAGAQVHGVARRGKGAVVQEMFQRCDADVILMVDGDATYPPDRARDLVDAVLHGGVDMAVGTRLHPSSVSTFRLLNRWGNRLYRLAVNILYHAQVTDLLSGYRAFSRRYLATVRPTSVGFEIETELTLRALKHGLKIVEIPVHLQARPQDSHSKIRLGRDGLAIFREILAHRTSGQPPWPVVASS